jgi:hypothetical protein
MHLIRLNTNHLQQEHYREAHSIALRHPDIIGVQLGSTGQDAIVVPAEMCTIVPGQFYKKKLPQNLMEKTRDFATMRPEKRLDIIRQGLSKRDGQILQPPVSTIFFLVLSVIHAHCS